MPRAGRAGKMKVLSRVHRRWKAGCGSARCANCVAENAVEVRGLAKGRVVRVGARCVIAEVFAKFLLGTPKKSRLQMGNLQDELWQGRSGLGGVRPVLVIGPSADLQGACNGFVRRTRAWHPTTVDGAAWGRSRSHSRAFKHTLIHTRSQIILWLMKRQWWSLFGTISQKMTEGF